MHTRILAPAFLVLVTLSLPAAAQTDSLSVERAVQRALSSSYTLRQADALREAAAARVRQSESGYYPDVNVSADYTRIGPIPELSLPGAGTFTLAPADNLDAHVALRQMIYDFGKRNAGVDLSKMGVQSAVDAQRSIRTGITVQTMSAFYAALLLQQSILVQDQQLQSLNEHLRITQQRVESGSATEFDALSTSVRVAQAQSQKVDLLKSLHDQEVTLRRLMDLSWDAPIALSGDFDSLPVEKSLDSLVSQSRVDRPDIVSAADQLRSAQLRANVEGLGDMPALKAHAAYGLKNGYIPNLNAIRGNWAVGVSVEVPLFNGYLTGSRREEAEAQVKAAEHRLRDAELNAEAEIRQAFSAVQSLQEKIAVSKLQVNQAVKAVENARVRYQSGAGTNLDVLDAETNVAMSQLQQLQAMYQSVIARIQLHAAAGAFGR